MLPETPGWTWEAPDAVWEQASCCPLPRGLDLPEGLLSGMKEGSVCGHPRTAKGCLLWR